MTPEQLEEIEAVISRAITARAACTEDASEAVWGEKDAAESEYYRVFDYMVDSAIYVDPPSLALTAALRQAWEERDEARDDLGTRAAVDVLAERKRQKTVEGWMPDHDDKHDNGEMGRAAACYAMESFDDDYNDSVNKGGKWVPYRWPWAPEWWKPKSIRKNLVRAGALILAEIERHDRAALKEPTHDQS